MKRTKTRLKLSNIQIELSSKTSISVEVDQSFQYKHRHALPELHICLSGSGVLCTEDKRTELSAGSCVLIGSNTPHYFEVDSDSSMLRLESMLKAKNSYIDDTFSWLNEENTVNYWVLDETHLTYAQMIVKELSESDSCYEDVITGYYLLLFTYLARTSKVASRLSLSQNEDSKKQIAEVYMRDQIADFLNLNYAKNITIDDLASHLNVSDRQAHRLVKQHTGFTFRQHLVFIRMEHAKYLLAKTNLPIYKIAEQLGYEYSSSFCKAFHHQNDISPEVYRARIQEKL